MPASDINAGRDAPAVAGYDPPAWRLRTDAAEARAAWWCYAPFTLRR